MIHVKTEVLRAAVVQAKAVCRQSTPLEILKYLKLSTSGDELTITASDTECQLSVTVPAECSDGVALCVEADRFAQALTGESIQITLQEARMTLKGGRSRFQLPTIPAAQWPGMDPAGPSVALVRAEWVAAAIESCLASVNPKEPRFHFRGLNFQSDGANVLTTGTNGHVALQASGITTSKPFNFILPRRACEIAATLESKSLTVYDRCALLVGDNFEFTSKLVDAKFPAGVDKFYPKPTGECALSRQELTECVTQMVPFAEIAQGTQKVSSVHLMLGADELKVMASNGSAETAVELAQNSHNGSALDRHYQAQYLKMLLKLIPTKEIVLKWDDRGVMMAEHENVKGVITPFNY